MCWVNFADRHKRPKDHVRWNHTCHPFWLAKWPWNMWCLPRISLQKPHHKLNAYVKHPIFLGHPLFTHFWGWWFHVVLQPSWAPTCRWWVRSATQSPPRIPAGRLDFRCICWSWFSVWSQKKIWFYTFIWYCIILGNSSSMQDLVSILLTQRRLADPGQEW